LKSLKDIFYERPRSIRELRKWQEEFSDLWQRVINAEVVGLRTPTGSGKTLIGLLILEQGLKKNKRGIYLTHTHQLMDRIGKEAKALDLPYVILGGAKNIKGSEYDKRKDEIFDYNRYKHIIISNYHAFLTTKDFPDNIDYLIIDDVDLFYNTLRNHFSIKIKNSGPTKEIFNQILNALSTRSYTTLEKIKEKTAQINDADLLFPQDYDIIKQIIGNNIAELNKDSDFYFPYQISRDYMDFYYWYLSNQELSIEPYIFPINKLKTPRSRVNRFNKIKKIVLLSATLGQKERFILELGLNRTQIKMICENNFKEEDLRMGERLIFPITELELSEINPISSEFVTTSLKYIKQFLISFKKIIILCWQIDEKKTVINFLKDKLEDVQIFDFTGRNYKIFEDFSKYPKNKKSVLIIANRYFGLDFPSSACKICVITRLPTFLSNFDTFINEFLKEQEYFNELLKRRIIQSIGRLNRTIKDNSVYYFLDPRFSDAIVQATSFYPLLNKEIKEILDFSYKKSSRGSFNDSLNKGKDFLSNTNNFRDEIFAILDPIRKESQPVDSNSILEKIYLNEILGWKYLYNNAYDNAVKEFEELNNKLNFKRRDPKYKKKIEWYNYIIYLIYYKREKLGDSSKIKELTSYFEKVKNSEILTWLNKIELYHTNDVKIRDKKSKIIPSKAQELFKEYAQEPKLYLGELIVLDEIKDSLSAIKESLLNLSTKQKSSPLRNLAIEFENICKKVLNRRELEIYKRLESNNKLVIAEILKVLKGKYYLRKSIFNKLDSEPRNLRNIIIHIKKEIPEYAEVIKNCNELKKGMVVLLREIYFSDLIRNAKGLPDMFRKVESFDYLNDQDIRSRILEMWHKEKAIFIPEVQDEFNFSSFSGKCCLKSEGKEYEIEIHLDI